MNSKIKQYIECTQSHYEEEIKPIFEILVFEKAAERLMFNGRDSGFPDMGAQDNVGYYHDFKDAYQAITENWCDIHETVYDAAFLICRFPGLYNPVGSDGRIYFLWDSNTNTYTETEEPEIFKHIAL